MTLTQCPGLLQLTHTHKQPVGLPVMKPGSRNKPFLMSYNDDMTVLSDSIFIGKSKQFTKLSLASAASVNKDRGGWAGIKNGPLHYWTDGQLKKYSLCFLVPKALILCAVKKGAKETALLICSWLALCGLNEHTDIKGRLEGSPEDQSTLTKQTPSNTSKQESGCCAVSSNLASSFQLNRDCIQNLTQDSRSEFEDVCLEVQGFDGSVYTCRKQWFNFN